MGTSKIDLAELTAAAAQADPEEMRILRKRLERAERLNQRRLAETEIVLDAAREALTERPYKLPPVKAPKRVRSGTDETAILHLSDLQGGKDTPTFNLDVLRERMSLCVDKVEVLTDARRSRMKVNSLHVYHGGDMIEGDGNIFPHQAHEVSCSTFDQLFTVAEILADGIRRLEGIFPTIHNVVVAGNHGRPGNKHSAGHPRTNWDRVLGRVVELMLKGSRSTWAISDTDMEVDRVYQWGNLLVHGDQVRGWGGIPFYGIAKKVAGWIDSHGAVEPWDNLYLGHFHTPAWGTHNYHYWYLNGTMESSNHYALSELAAAGHPAQRFQFANADHGIVADHILYLDERLPMARWPERWKRTAEAKQAARKRA